MPSKIRHDQPATQQSLRAVFERSWLLLPADLQQVLALAEQVSTGD
jgi:hypothetical protein